jgi:hypothetical protein
MGDIYHKQSTRQPENCYKKIYGTGTLRICLTLAIRMQSEKVLYPLWYEYIFLKLVSRHSVPVSKHNSPFFSFLFITSVCDSLQHNSGTGLFGTIDILLVS